MNHIMYIHGFNSGAQSRSARLLAETLNCKVSLLLYDCAQDFITCQQSLITQIRTIATPQHRVCLIGSSLGGFYALQMTLPIIAHCIAFNPLTQPEKQLEPMLGENINFSTGERWLFSSQALESYANAIDSRRHPIPKDIILGRHDELIPPNMAAQYWKQHATITYSDDTHQIADFTPFLPILRRYWKPEENT